MTIIPPTPTPIEIGITDPEVEGADDGVESELIVIKVDVPVVCGSDDDISTVEMD